MTKKNTRGVARLIESEIEKVEIVLAAKSIPDTLQKMAEDLAKIEADDVMPLLDQMKAALGPQATNRFSQAVTAKVRELLDTVKLTKDAIDVEITNLENIANGEPGNDMAMDAAPEMDGPPAPPASDVGTNVPPASDEDVPADNLAMDDFKDGGAAGRMRKESATRRLSPAVRKLRESTNPDAMILAAFRGQLQAGRKVLESAKRVSRTFEIDLDDVVSIVREAKTAKRPFDKKASVKEAKQKLIYRAKWNPQTHWFDILDMNDRVVAKDVAANETKAKKIAADYRPGTVIEAVGVPPKTPDDMRANQDAQQQQGQAQKDAGKPVAKVVPAGNKPVEPAQTPSAATAPNVPGTVVTKAPLVPNMTKPPVPGRNPVDPNAKPVPGQPKPQPNGQPNGQPNVKPGQEEANEETDGVVEAPKTTKTGGSSITLFSKTKPLPAPGGTLMGSAPMTLGETKLLRRIMKNS